MFGDVEAERIKNEASAIGSALHKNLEDYIYHDTPPVRHRYGEIAIKGND